MTATAPTSVEHAADVDDMYVIHRVFRRELPALAEAVRGVRTTAHVRIVAGHLELVLAGLHMHHSGEDAIVWPLLTERCPGEVDVVRCLESQHEGIALAAEAVDARLAGWATTPIPAYRDELADAIDELTAVLTTHLALEEEEGLPLMRRSLTADEWAQVGTHGRTSMSSKQLPLLFGMLLEGATPEEAAKLSAELPPPVRLYLQTLGARRYRRYIAEVRSI
ncbi:MAG: hemerythrin domain-containing protein, partial [Acidimicrobiia bacterium]|nr:hemerythrin domain-containing protein [Acidimicrobiia bacterium]